MQVITLHQALHGYSDGHRVLGTSITLDAQDAKTMLILSDVSGPGSRLERSGYLTGYPLPQSGFYALARTWPAPEMSRPGCVWTHTLLIDFSDLATINNPSRLLRLFERPDQFLSGRYKQTLAFEETQQKLFVEQPIVAFAKPLIATLYQYPSKRVVSFDAGPETSEKAVLELWAQQWPRLRRSFRFCTLTSTDRSTNEMPFDLQLLPKAMSNVRGRFDDVVDARAPDNVPEWLQVALDDLKTAGLDGLRRFLFQAGSDLQDGRSHFSTLCLIFELLEGTKRSQADLEAALDLIPKQSDTSIARALKSVVVRSLVKQDINLSKPVLSYVVDHFDMLDSHGSNEDAVNFGRSLLKAQPSLFLKMRQKKNLGELVFQKVLTSALDEEIYTAVEGNSGLVPHVLETRRGMLRHPEFWHHIVSADVEALDRFDQRDDAKEALCAAIISQRMDLASTLLERADRIELIAALHQTLVLDSINFDSLGRWLRLVSTPHVLTEFFSTHKKIDRRFLVAVSQTYAPEDILGGGKADPWLRALEVSVNEVSDHDELHLRSYLLTRALGNCSRSSAKLAQFGFDATYHALAQGTLPYESWSRLDRLLPWSIVWPEWDKCRRLRRGLVDQCIENFWTANDFVCLTQDDELFAELVSYARGSYRGHKYLKSIKTDLKATKDPHVRNRYRNLMHVLKSY